MKPDWDNHDERIPKHQERCPEVRIKELAVSIRAGTDRVTFIGRSGSYISASQDDVQDLQEVR